jgi:hypothetical protein
VGVSPNCRATESGNSIVICMKDINTFSHILATASLLFGGATAINYGEKAV